MRDEAEHEAVIAAMRAINRAWLDQRPEDLAPLFHPDVTTVVPGFVARVQGREKFLAGFVDFCSQATIHEYREEDLTVDIAGDTAVVSYRWEMVYERAGAIPGRRTRPLGLRTSRGSLACRLADDARCE